MGSGWVICGWGIGARHYWSETERGWGTLDRAAHYPTRRGAQAVADKTELPAHIQIRTVISAEQAAGDGRPRSIWESV